MTEVKTSVEDTLAQRGSRYGDFTDHARICQNLMGQMQLFEKPLKGQENIKEGDRIFYKPWEHLSPVQRQALTVIADKIARILSGDPNYDDNWHDIQGYAKLVEDRLPKPVPVISEPVEMSALEKLTNSRGSGQ